VLEIGERLVAWYRRHARRLPWRASPGQLAADPYAVWISEVMLQQTQVETVKPYFARWMTAFPSVEALAQAPLDSVLRVWEGLGYYSRARNLHRAGQTVVREHGGRLPNTLDGLRSLPGIGAYTAAAIGSIAFGLDVPVVDGNVKRVFARVFDYTGDIATPRSEAEIRRFAAECLPAGQACDYNQAIMDLGATVCTPKNPACLICPLLGLCVAQAQGVQDERPMRGKKRAVPARGLVVAVIERKGQVLLTQRNEGGLLGGLWAFPSGPLPQATSPTPRQARQGLRAGLDLDLDLHVDDPLLVVEHAYTHFRVTAHVFHARLTGRAPRGYTWVRLTALDQYAMGKVDRRIAQKIVEGR
jgi:A/G-specific adenine glycosylase